MEVVEYTPQGQKIRILTQTEMKKRAETGDRMALSEWVKSKGGYDSLTATQKNKIIKILISETVTL